MSRDDGSLEDLSAALTAIARTVRQHRLFRHLDERAKVSIRPRHYLLFARIAEREPARISDLAAEMEVDRSTISRQVAELVRDGHLERVSDPDDGRSVILRMTPSGRAAQAAIVKAWQDVLREATSRLTASERAKLARQLEELAASIEAVMAGDGKVAGAR